MRTASMGLGLDRNHFHGFVDQQAELIRVEPGLARAHFQGCLDTENRAALAIPKLPLVPRPLCSTVIVCASLLLLIDRTSTTHPTLMPL